MRCIDVVGALAIGLAISPIALVAALVVRVTSRGPVIFRQERVGEGGELFDVLKFRTMSDGTHGEVLSDEEMHRRYVENDFKLPADDPRITSIGRWLRRTSIDEVPQLMNVLRGEMGLVGARPIERAQLERRSPYDQALYCQHKPALTGVWQIAGRSEYRDEHRDDLDRIGLEQWTVINNLKILVRTPKAVIVGAGAH